MFVRINLPHEDHVDDLMGESRGEAIAWHDCLTPSRPARFGCPDWSEPLVARIRLTGFLPVESFRILVFISIKAKYEKKLHVWARVAPHI
jgi:hypothetical protein